MIVKVGGTLYSEDGLIWIKPYKTMISVECILASYITSFPKKGNWYVYLDIVQGTTINCYLFKKIEDYRLWSRLRQVKSLGSRKAALILSSYPTDKLLRIIAYGDVEALKILKGIGDKTAKRMLAELKDEVRSSIAGLDDVRKLLVSWGYSRREVNRAISQLYTEDRNLDELDFDTLVRKLIQVIESE